MILRVTKKAKGFSLVEMVVAAVLLSGAVVTICSISARGMMGVKLNAEYEQAWEVLDRQLILIDYMGIDEFIEMDQMEGQFGDEESSATVHYWQVDIQELEPDALYKIDMTVSWGSEKRPYSVSASTMLNGKNAAMLPEEAEAR